MKAVHLKQVPLIKIVYVGSPYYITVFNLNTSFFSLIVWVCVSLFGKAGPGLPAGQGSTYILWKRMSQPTLPPTDLKTLHKYINKVFSASCEFLTSDIFHINVDSTAISVVRQHFLQLVRLGICKLIVKLLITICQLYFKPI